MAEGIRPELVSVVNSLSSIDSDVRLAAVRALKNAIIGNKQRKKEFVECGALPKLVDILSTEQDTEMLVQSAVAIGSFSFGTEECVAAILQSGVISSLLRLLSHPTQRVVLSALRSAKNLMQSCNAPRGEIFNQPILSRLIAMIDDSTTPGSQDVSELAAQLLAWCVETQEQQQKVAELGGIGSLMMLLSSPNRRCVEGALQALAAVSRNNLVVVGGGGLADHPAALSQILALVRDPRPATRFLALECISNLCKAGGLGLLRREVVCGLVGAVVKLFSPSCALSADHLIKAPLILAQLAAHDEELQRAFCEADSVSKLGALLAQTPCPDPLKANILSAFAVLSSREDNGQYVVEARIMPVVVAALSAANVELRLAACNLVRSLSRSVKVLRAVLPDADLVAPLFDLLSDGEVAVQTAACATVCNIVLEYGPMKKYVLQHRGVAKLVAMIKSVNSQLRLTAVWAVKNLVFRAEPAIKREVTKELTLPFLLRLLQDEPLIQEQALTILRNLAHGSAEDVKHLCLEAGPELLPALEAKLHNTTLAPLLVQALYVVCNIAAASQDHQDLLMASPLLPKLLPLLTHHAAAVRMAALWCVINLTWPRDPGVQARIQKLRALGFEDKLLLLAADPDLDVKERVKCALTQFGGGLGGHPPSGSSSAMCAVY